MNFKSKGRTSLSLSATVSVTLILAFPLGETGKTSEATSVSSSDRSSESAGSAVGIAEYAAELPMGPEKLEVEGRMKKYVKGMAKGRIWRYRALSQHHLGECSNGSALTPDSATPRVTPRLRTSHQKPAPPTPAPPVPLAK